MSSNKPNAPSNKAHRQTELEMSKPEHRAWIKSVLGVKHPALSKGGDNSVTLKGDDDEVVCDVGKASDGEGAESGEDT